MQPREESLDNDGAPQNGRPRQATHSRDAIDERELDERGFDEREASERELDDDEALELFRDSLHQTVLPDLPYMPGYHVCWLTTSNGRDSLQWRRRIGYELIRLDDVPGWSDGNLKTAEGDGYVRINEMVAARIPLSRYNKYMREVHHTMPLQEEMKIRASVDEIKASASDVNGRVDEGDGMAQIVQRARPPRDFDR